MNEEQKYSVAHEPAFHHQIFVPDLAEQRAARDTTVASSEYEAARDSVWNEPALGAVGEAPTFRQWVESRRRENTTAGNLLVTAAAALVAGPFAVFGAFMAGTQGLPGVLYIVVGAPIIEEFLKQSGMIYLLEKKPHRIAASWQFVCTAVVAALVFAGIENLLYIHVYADPSKIGDMAMFRAFRWIVCTTLHVSCAVIGSLGLIRVWRRQCVDGRPADIRIAYPFLAGAALVHGLYNLAAVLFDALFISRGGALLHGGITP